MTLCYATFERALQRALTSEKSDEKITNLLLGFVIDTADVRDTHNEAEPYFISPKQANKWLNQEAELYSEIKKASGNPDVCEGAEEFFSLYVLNLITENRRLDLIAELRGIVGNDDTIASATKDRLLRNADETHLTSFLADTFLYALGKPNKLSPDRRRKETKTKSESEQLITVKNAINALPTDAVNKLVQFLMSTVYAVEPSEQERFQDFKDTAFRNAVQNLLDSGRMTYQEFYKTKNFLEIAAIADEELHNDEVIHPVAMDFDWFFRFFEAAGSISNEDMQRLWAKVLAGEIREQGSFSLRTVEVLRNMTAREAQVFQRACRLVLSETDGAQFLFCDDSIGNYDLNERHGLSAGDLFLLEECGLVNAFCINNIMELENGAGGFISYSGQMLLIESKDDERHSFHYKSYPLSRAATQLLPIVWDGEHDDYVIELGKLLKDEQGEHLRISVHDMMSMGEDGEVELDLEHDYLIDN